MKSIRSRDVAIMMLSVVIMAVECSAVKVDLVELLRERNRNPTRLSQKRVVGGNPCQEPDQPWPCRSTRTCIPMSYICDENYDCEDGSDEDRDMCTANPGGDANAMSAIIGVIKPGLRHFGRFTHAPRTLTASETEFDESRPPVEDIVSFLESQKNWIIPNLFGNRNIYKVAHGLAVSQTVDDFRRRLGMSTKDTKNLVRALNDIKKGREEAMGRYGMPKSAWNEVNFFFARLIKAGFA
ncbi:hypothetical protein LSH36_154g11010 [Paralvinella palmiformis]|uniref:Prohormone-4 n=1 Tax=Paralvinella palmiformis TaxID=53620 RepID=A0AAD9JUK3_9ANNE|nr:hypothetical protein LSH36_154g11010 [Paralvinella palmiformis]